MSGMRTRQSSSRRKSSSDAGSRDNPPRIALLVGAWNEYGRGIIEGVWQYAEQHGPWFLEMDPSEPDENIDVPRGWNGDGMIAGIQTRRLEEKLIRLGIPVVNVSGSSRSGDHFPRVTTDADAVMDMAIGHLRQKGLKHIAFCGEPQRPFINFWTESFRRSMADAGEKAMVYHPSRQLSAKAGIEERQNDRRRWIESLPKPVGIIGWATGICRQLAMACGTAGFQVPEDCAIISLETEDLLGKVVHPPISGVDIPVKRIGYEAAARLDQMMRGERANPHETRLMPLGVTTRQSTELIACDDPQVRQALRFIREHSHDGIDVRDVLKAVPMARRSLERRFQSVTGRSPAEEIRRTKIERVRRLLDTTDLPIPDIAEACGFKYFEHMIPVFRKYHGCTPSRYRKNARLGV